MSHCCQTTGIHCQVLDRFPHLQLEQSLRCGSLYRCQICGCAWFRPPQPGFLQRLDPELLPLLDHWNSQSWQLQEAAASVLCAIGGVQCDYLQAVEFPCEVQTYDGIWHSKVLVRVASTPPTRHVMEKLLWPDQVAEVRPSSLAFSHAVRQAAAQRPEESMGFAPLPLENPAGEICTLRYSGQFYEGHYGPAPDLKLGTHGRGWLGWPNLIEPSPPERYVVVHPRD